MDVIPPNVADAGPPDAGAGCERRGDGSIAFNGGQYWDSTLGSPKPIVRGSALCPADRDPEGDLIAALSQCASMDFVLGDFVLHVDSAGAVYDVDWLSLGGNDPAPVIQCVNALTAAACYPSYACRDLTIDFFFSNP